MRRINLCLCENSGEWKMVENSASEVWVEFSSENFLKIFFKNFRVLKRR